MIKKHWQLLVLIIFSLTPVVWFLGRDPGVLIDGVDTNFPLNPLVWFGRRLFVWNSVVNAGTDFSSSVSGLFFHLIQVLPYLAGFSLRTVEILSLLFWFTTTIIFSFLLARVLVAKNKLAQIIFVSLYSFNIYLFNTWENVKVANLSLVATLPAFVLLVYLWSNGMLKTKRALLFSTILAILASGSGINPAYFFVIILTIVIEAVVLAISKRNKEFLKSSFTAGFGAIIVLFLVNLFWIAPLANFLISNKTASLSDLGLANWLASLSENTSLVNIVRLQGAWDWYAVDSYGMPLYLPYTLNYLYRFPFIIFSFVVPVLSFLSFIIINSKKRFWYMFFGLLALLGIFMGVGSHEPTGGILLFLYNHIPFLSFFRSPWYIFTPILTLSYAGLTALLFENVGLLTSNRFLSKAFSVTGVIFLIFYGLYNYPLISGKIFRPGQNGFYVKFPDYVWQTANWLENNKDNQRIISYPDDDVEKFTWGYTGTESILTLFSDREIITPSFNISSQAFSALLADFNSHIKRKEYQSAINDLNFFGADEIFYKKDVQSLAAPIDSDIENLVETQKFGDWSFLKAKEEINPKIYIPSIIYDNFTQDPTIYEAQISKNKAAILNTANDSEIAKIPSKNSFAILLKANNIVEENQENNVKKYRFFLPKDGSFTIRAERLFLAKDSIKVLVDQNPIDKKLIDYKDSFISIGPLNLSTGQHLVQIDYPVQDNLFVASNYSQYANDSGLRREELPADTTKTLVAFNSQNKEKSIMLSTDGFNPFLHYSITLDYKYLYGSVPIVDMIQSAPTAPVKSNPIYPGGNFDWETKTNIFKPVETNSKLEMFIKLPPNEKGNISKAYFENISIKRVYDNKVFVVENEGNPISVNSPTIQFQKKSPVEYSVQVNQTENSKNGIVLVFLESYSKDWILKPEKAGSSIVIPHFTTNGYANGWYIPASITNERFTLYYQPQRLFLFGAVISLGTIILLILANLIPAKR